jgi:arylsulfatase
LRFARRALAVLGLLVLAGGCRPGTLARPHVLLVVVDTLRADHLGAYGDPRGLSPHIDALAEESVVFRRAYSPASYTLPSVVGLLTGRFPQSLGVHANLAIFQGAVPTLAVRLRSHGWRTAAVVSNPVLERRVGLHVGFDHYDDVRVNREGRATTDAALRRIDEHVATHPGTPLFLWVHYQDPHGPYAPPPGYRERHLAAEAGRPDGARELPRDPTHVGLGAIPKNVWVEGHPEVSYYRAGYAGEVQFVDEQVGRLLDHAARALGDDTVVVFAADHGEAMGEGDYWFAHGAHLTDPLVRVPLLIHAPGLAPERRADVASLVDLYPTLLRLAARGDVPPVYPGRDLLAEGASRAPSFAYFATLGGSRVPRVGIAHRDWKYVAARRDDAWQGALYRRSAGGLEEPVMGAVELENVMSSGLSETLARLGPLPPETRQELAPEDLARLEALGYAEAGAPAAK